MPPDRSAQKLRRWIDLIVALLRRRSAVSFEELKGDVPAYATAKTAPESVLRTFERDKDELIAFGIPIELSSDDMGVRRFYRLEPTDFFLPYLTLVGGAASTAKPSRRRTPADRGLDELMFTPDELELVVRAGHRVQQLGDARLAADAAGALRKLAFDMPVPESDGTEQVHVDRQHDDPAVLDLLDQSLRARKIVRFAYHSMGRDTHERREVEPWGLVFLAGYWYLLGADHGVGKLKRFRVNRMSAVDIERARPHTPDFTVPDSFDISVYAKWQEAWQIGDGDVMQVTVQFTGSAGVVTEAARLGAPVQGAPDQRCFEVRKSATFARWLLRLAGEARPVSPPEFVTAWRDMAQATAAIYGASR